VAFALVLMYLLFYYFMLKYTQHIRAITALLAPFRRRILSSNEPETAELPRHEDGNSTVKLPAIMLETEGVRPSDRSGPTVIVSSVLFRDDPAATAMASTPASTPMLLDGVVQRFTNYVAGLKPIQAMFAVSLLAICFGIGLLGGGLWLANEAGILPEALPGFDQAEPVPSKASTEKEHTAAPSAAPGPSNWKPVVAPAAPMQGKSSASPTVTASLPARVSASPSASPSAPAQPEASSSAAQPTSPETTAQGTTSSAPTPTSSSPENEPTSPASDAATPPAGGTASTNPEVVDPAVTP